MGGGLRPLLYGWVQCAFHPLCFPSAFWGLPPNHWCTHCPPCPASAMHTGCSLTCDCAPPSSGGSSFPVMSHAPRVTHTQLHSCTQSACPITHSFADLFPQLQSPAPGAQCSCTRCLHPQAAIHCHCTTHSGTLGQCHTHGLTRAPHPTELHPDGTCSHTHIHTHSRTPVP